MALDVGVKGFAIGVKWQSTRTEPSDEVEHEAIGNRDLFLNTLTKIECQYDLVNDEEKQSAL